jgi:hypothetical protein
MLATMEAIAMSVDKIWRDILATKIPRDTIARPDEIDEVISIMTAIRIDPRQFAANLM